MLFNEWARLLTFDAWQHVSKLAQKEGRAWQPQPITKWLATVKAWSDRQANPAAKVWVDPADLEFEDDVDVAMLPREEW
jgi:hypothetical protein